MNSPSDDLLVAESGASLGEPVTGCEHLRMGLDVDLHSWSGCNPKESSVESGSGVIP